MNLAIWLQRSAALRPDAPAIYAGRDLRYDYQTFCDRAAAFGAALLERIQTNPATEHPPRIALFAENTLDYLVALFGTWYAGMAVVPINAKLHPAEAAWIIDDAKVSWVLTSDKLLGPLSARCADTYPLLSLQQEECQDMMQGERLAEPLECSTNTLAWLFYTSGTTGRPKGVMITHGNLAAMTHAYFTDVDDVSAEDKTLYAAPISHGAGLYCLPHVLKGAAHIIPAAGFDPDEILDLAQHHQRLHMFAAPTMVKRLVDHVKSSGRKVDGIQTIVYGGGPMYLNDIMEAVETLGPCLCQIYGQGESPMCITALNKQLVADRSHPRWRDRLASAGHAQACVEVRIADKEGNTLGSNTVGEILCRGAPVMAGYWNNPEATASTLKDGWLWTGDIGELSEDGFLTMKDRSKDLIISGGSNIYPREVEEILLLHPQVSEVSVIGHPHTHWGEIVVAFVVPVDSSCSTQELEAHCNDNIARFKRPKRWVIVDALPKNNYGKVLKTELRARLLKEDLTGNL